MSIVVGSGQQYGVRFVPAHVPVLVVTTADRFARGAPSDDSSRLPMGKEEPGFTSHFRRFPQSSRGERGKAPLKSGRVRLVFSEGDAEDRDREETRQREGDIT